MKKTLAVVLMLAVLVPLTALAQATTGDGWWQESQALNRTAPSAASEGLLVTRMPGFRITVCAPSGQTLTSGTIKMYYYNAPLALWTRNPSLDQTITAAGERCQTFTDFRTSFLVKSARMLPAASSVVLSGGTTVTVVVEHP